MVSSLISKEQVCYLFYLKVALLVASQMSYCVLGLVRSKKNTKYLAWSGFKQEQNYLLAWSGLHKLFDVLIS